MDKVPRRLQYEECESEEAYQLKYCSTCKKNKCCGPDKAREIKVQFRCPENKIIIKPFELIKTCKCYRMDKCPL